VPRTPEAQQDALTLGGTRDLSQHMAPVLSVWGYEKAQARQRESRSQRAAHWTGSPDRNGKLK
jgi:hypothetical protein